MSSKIYGSFKVGDVVGVVNHANPMFGDVLVILRKDDLRWLCYSVVTGDEYCPPVSHLSQSFDKEMLPVVRWRVSSSTSR